MNGQSGCPDRQRVQFESSMIVSTSPVEVVRTSPLSTKQAGISQPAQAPAGVRNVSLSA